MQAGAEQQRRIVQQRQLLRLAIGHETLQTQHPRYRRQGAQARRQRAAVGVRLEHHGERARCGVGVPAQFPVDLHRLGIRVAQLHRIVVEPGPRRGHQCGYADECSGAEYQAAPAGQPAETPPGPPAAGCMRRRHAGTEKKAQPCRQHGEARSQADQHARAGDQTQLRDADEGRGNEGVEGGRRGQRTEYERAADIRPAAGERLGELGAASAELADPQGVVDDKVDSEPDVEHRESHRNQIQLSDGPGRERRRRDEPAGQRHERGEQHPRRAHGEPQHRDHGGQHQQAGAARVRHHANELLVLQRDAAGKTNAHPCGLADLGGPDTQNPHGRQRRAQP